MQKDINKIVILAIDDNPLMRRILERALAQYCQTFHFVTNQREAGTIFATHGVTHVIADYDMGPDHPTGNELIVTWKSDFPSVRRAIILSGKDLARVPIPTEVDGVLGKPCDGEKLRSVLGIS